METRPIRPLALVCLLFAAAVGAAGQVREVTEAFDVRAFGAVPDDDSEDTAAIQAAIDAAPDGGTIRFPAGVYYSHGLRIIGRAGLALTGDGPDASLLRRPVTAPADARIATMEGCVDMVVTQLGFDVNGISRYGGFMCADCRRVTFARNHFFDSHKQPLGAQDRYAIVFGFGARPHEDILICQNRVEDLQVEVDDARRVRIVGNTVARPVKTAGIGTFTIAPKGGLAEAFEIAGNTIIDPVLSAGAITVHLDPPSSNDATFRDIRIRDNAVIYTAALKAASGQSWDGPEGQTWPPAVQVGTGDNSQATHGNVFEDISIEGNTVWVDPSLGSVRYGIFFANASAKSNFRFRNLTVVDNVVFYDGPEAILNIAFGDSSRVEGLQQSGNVLRRLERADAGR